MAISSLSDDSRPTAIRVPNRSDIGRVRTTMFGRVSSSSLPTIDDRQSAADDHLRGLRRGTGRSRMKV